MTWSILSTEAAYFNRYLTDALTYCICFDYAAFCCLRGTRDVMSLRRCFILFGSFLSPVSNSSTRAECSKAIVLRCFMRETNDYVFLIFILRLELHVVSTECPSSPFPNLTLNYKGIFPTNMDRAHFTSCRPILLSSVVFKVSFDCFLTI